MTSSPSLLLHDWIATHRRPMLMALGTMMISTSVVAFGATSSLPDAAQRTVDLVGEASIALSELSASRPLRKGHSGDLVAVTRTTDRCPQKLLVPWMHASDQRVNRLGVAQQAGDHLSWLACPEPQRVVRFGAQIVRSAFHTATKPAHVPGAVCSQVLEPFSGCINPARELSPAACSGMVEKACELDGDILLADRWLSDGTQDGADTQRAMLPAREGRPGDFVSLEQSRVSVVFLASPLASPKVTSSYGPRVHPVSGVRKAHRGTDYGARPGTPVRTVADGLVTFAGRQGGYGNQVVIRHPDATTTSYAHLERITVSVGQRVYQGQNVGTVGSTGTTTGPNLHFEYLVQGVRTNPAHILGSQQPSATSQAGPPLAKQEPDAMDDQLRMAASVAPSGVDRADRATETP